MNRADLLEHITACNTVFGFSGLLSISGHFSTKAVVNTLYYAAVNIIIKHLTQVLAKWSCTNIIMQNLHVCVWLFNDNHNYGF